MARRYIALEMEPGVVRFAVAEGSEREAKLLAARTLDVEAGNDLRVCLEELREEVEPGFTDVVELLLPARESYARVLDYPFKNRRKLQAIAPPDLVHRLPVDADGLLIDLLPSAAGPQACRVAAASMKREKLAELTDLFRSAGFPLTRVSLLPWRLAGENDQHGERLLLAWVRDDEAGLALCEKGQVRHYVLRVGGAPREVLAPWLEQQAQVLERRDGWSGLAIRVFGGDEALRQRLAGSGREILEPGPDGLDADLERVAHCALTGLRGARCHNFLKGDFAPSGGMEGLRIPLRRSLMLSLLVLLLGLTTLGSGYYRNAREAKRLEAQAEQVLRRTFPEIGSIRDARLQMQAQLQQLRSRAGARSGVHAAPLELLRAMSRHLPEDVEVNLDEWTLANSEVRLEGSTASFEDVERLAEVFGDLEGVEQAVVAESKAGRDNRVKFRMRLTLGGEP